MTLTKYQQETVKNNLRAYLKNFAPIRIKRSNYYGNGFYVFQEGQDIYVQYCYNIHYLSGWLDGAVQAKNHIVN